jgi:hypothetical protein
MGGRVTVIITIFCHHISIFLMNGMGAKYEYLNIFNELLGLGWVWGAVSCRYYYINYESLPTLFYCLIFLIFRSRETQER